MGLEEVDRLLDAVLQLELQLDRVGLQVDEPAGRVSSGRGWVPPWRLISSSAEP